MMPFPGPLIATQFARQTGRPEYVYYEIVGPFDDRVGNVGVSACSD